MDASRGTKRVLAENRVIRRDRHPRPLGDDLAHFAQLPQVCVDPPQQAEVHQQQIEVRVADALAQAERATVDPVGAGNGRLDGIDDAEAAIAVAVPVEADVRFHLVQHPADVADHRTGAIGRRVADRVADRDARRAFFDCRAEEAAQRIRLRPGGVLRDVEHWKFVLPREAHGLARVVHHLLDRPAFGVLPDRAGTDEGGHLDRDADSLRDLDHRTDVELERSRRAEGLDPHVLVADLLGQAFDIRDGAGARARKTEIDRAHAELIGQVQEAQLVFDVGVANRGPLDAVAERFVVNGDGMVQLRRCVDRVPVVDQLRFVRH